VTLANVYADAEGALIAWAAADNTLTGRGNPIAAGLHITDVHSPAEGAIGYVEVLSRTTDDVADMARVSVTVMARKRGVAEAGARAFAERLHRIVRTAPTVTTSRGDRVKLWAAGDIAGPAFAGEFGGEVGYRVDATLALQPQ
jgi:hypothetical protein